MNRDCQHKVRTENKNRKGKFMSLGKISNWEPHEGYFIENDTGVEEDGPNV